MIIYEMGHFKRELLKSKSKKKALFFFRWFQGNQYTVVEAHYGSGGNDSCYDLGVTSVAWL